MLKPINARDPEKVKIVIPEKGGKRPRSEKILSPDRQPEKKNTQRHVVAQWRTATERCTLAAQM